MPLHLSPEDIERLGPQAQAQVRAALADDIRGHGGKAPPPSLSGMAIRAMVGSSGGGWLGPGLAYVLGALLLGAFVFGTVYGAGGGRATTARLQQEVEALKRWQYRCEVAGAIVLTADRLACEALQGRPAGLAPARDAAREIDGAGDRAPAAPPAVAALRAPNEQQAAAEIARTRVEMEGESASLFYRPGSLTTIPDGRGGTLSVALGLPLPPGSRPEESASKALMAGMLAFFWHDQEFLGWDSDQAHYIVAVSSPGPGVFQLSYLDRAGGNLRHVSMTQRWDGQRLVASGEPPSYRLGRVVRAGATAAAAAPAQRPAPPTKRVSAPGGTAEIPADWDDTGRYFYRSPDGRYSLRIEKVWQLIYDARDIGWNGAPFQVVHLLPKAFEGLRDLRTQPLTPYSMSWRAVNSSGDRVRLGVVAVGGVCDAAGCREAARATVSAPVGETALAERILATVRLNVPPPGGPTDPTPETQSTDATEDVAIGPPGTRILQDREGRPYVLYPDGSTTACPPKITGRIIGTSIGQGYLPVRLGVKGPAGWKSVHGRIDTGAVMTAFPDSVLRAAGFTPERETTTHGVGGASRTFVYRIPAPYIVVGSVAGLGGTWQPVASGMVTVWGLTDFPDALLGADLLRYGDFRINGLRWEFQPRCSATR